MIMYQRVFKLQSGHENASETIKRNNSESAKVRVVILGDDTASSLFYITVKYHDNVPKGIQVMERTRNCF